jgi:hypothetical protein
MVRRPLMRGDIGSSEANMADENTILWEGASGEKYKYWIHPIGRTLKVAPGNYIFAKETKPNFFRPIYIGETGDLSTRFDDHHKESCIKREGATHIHVHTSSDNKDVRKAEETDLMNKWNPPCNG